MTRFIIFFQWKTHLIKVLEIGSPTTDLRIWPLKSRSAIVESFLLSSRTPPQNLSWNGSRLVVQTTDQSFGDKNNESPLPLSPFFFLNQQPPPVHGPICKAQWINSLCFNNPHLTAHYPTFWFISFFFYLFSFAYFISNSFFLITHNLIY